jgi:uncharacterized protein YjbJ (UPF0337 family)
MSGNIDKAKGHAKEAIGDLTDDKDLEAEGRKDRAAGGVKEAATTAKEKVEDTVDRVRDKLSDNR